MTKELTKEFLETIKEEKEAYKKSHLPELKIFNNAETKNVSRLHYKKDFSNDMLIIKDEVYDLSAIYFKNNTHDNLIARIMMDKKIEDNLDKDKLADFLLKNADDNSLSCINHIVFTYDEDLDNQDESIRDDLRDIIDDDIVFFCGTNNFGGVYDNEQTIFINYLNIEKQAEDFVKENNTVDIEDVIRSSICYALFYSMQELDYAYNILNEEDYPSIKSQNKAFEKNAIDKMSECIDDFNILKDDKEQEQGLELA